MTTRLSTGLLAATLALAFVPSPATATEPASQVRFTHVGDRLVYQVTGQDRNHFRAFTEPDGQVHVIPAHATASVTNSKLSRVDTREALHPVQVTAIGLDGGPTQAFAFLLNTDSFAKAEVQLSFDDNGIARTQVPAGHYMVYLDGVSSPTVVQLVLDDLVVAGPGTTTIVADERSATAPVTVGAPRPAIVDHFGRIVVRTDATGATWSLNAFLPGQDRLVVNPAPAPRVGTRAAVLTWTALSPGLAGGSGPNYTYDAAFRTSGATPPDQHFVIQPGRVAVVQPSFHHNPGQAAPGRGDQVMIPADPVLDLLPGVPAITTPTDFTGLTQYLATSDGGRWSPVVFPTAELGLSRPTTTYQAGHHYPVTWAKGPIAPSARGRTHDSCDFCVTGDQLQFFGGRFATGDPAESAVVIGQVTAQHYTITRDGAPIYDSTDDFQQPSGTVSWLPAGAANYRFVYDLDMTGKAEFGQSTTSHTDITAHYDPTSPAVADPAACYGATAPCQVLPVLALRYGLSGLDVTNSSTTATQELTVDVSHYHLDGVGSTSPIRTVTVELSFDGTTWRPVPVTGSGGHYTAQWPNSWGAQGCSPSLRTTATDQAGNRITQTITNAYTIDTR